ncbi:GAF domain-containing protein [Altererythrobacter confluentis]|uniref:histidine kinase n=1 Tax=Allopontixanthobacter confluentis TaxID=1849021 RepID=A0A6L7GDG1_9SPHN|nr:HWE histidine kinase domain-containing protein [Allopontixanthobacter confluentis]MXP13168.1 GAF domain-containing protein [Allopontixanthobacter confluentis]
MRLNDPQADLTQCDREPIHQLNMIQPFGGLIAVNSDWIITHHSVNAGEILGSTDDIGAGMLLSQFILPEGLAALQAGLRRISHADTVERIFGVALTSREALLDVALHQIDGHIVIEFEPHDAKSHADSSGVLRPMITDLDLYQDENILCQSAAEHLKDLLLFDRVMVYKFHPDGTGEVIAEAVEADLEPFLHLRYPKSDIPQQARALYLRNLFRIISDVNAVPVPIEPSVSFDGQTLDLSLSSLRAVSPVHIEYLQNMGIAASLSISIVIRGKLWGLFACHHRTPRILPYSQRTSAELFSQIFSLQLDRTISERKSQLWQDGRKLHDRLMARLAGGVSLVDSLPTLGQAIADVIPHDGSSAYVDGNYQKRGIAPTEAEFQALVRGLNTSATSSVIASSHLAQNVPAAAAFADRLAGALIIPVSRRPRDYFVLWRRPLKQSVTWAGNPEKPVETSNGEARLSPRKSFAAWQQQIDDKSADWTEAELQMAESLRVTLLEVILRVTDDAVRELARAKEQQELLIAELNHRVRNILNLIRGLINQSRSEAGDVGSFIDLIGGRVSALAKAHDNITKENWNPASLKELITSEAEAFFAGKEDRIVISGVDVLVAPEAYTVLALVMHEMMTNSAKYGSLCDSSGTLAITLSRDIHDDLLIDWREMGGPAVKPPTRRGFGSTIIERSIPYEIGGDAKVHYKLGGVQAQFLIPNRFVTQYTRAMESADAVKKLSDEQSASDNPIADELNHVLLVEDSMIIALDSEDCLRQLGIDTVTMASTVKAALRLIEDDAPQLAILDYNLGDETSDLVAQKLHSLRIPFAFATGYGEMADELNEKGAMAVLKKPYTKDDIAQLLAKFTVA